MKSPRLLFIAICLVATTGLTAQKRPSRVSFPAVAEQAISPDGRFAVVNVDSDSEPHHTLYLQDRQTKSQWKLVDYARSVDVLWSPTSSLIAITNHVGSNASECFLFSTTAGNSPVNVGSEIVRAMANPRDLASIQKNHHVYFEAVGWTSPNVVRVKVWGYGDADPRGFTRFYSWRVPQ